LVFSQGDRRAATDRAGGYAGRPFEAAALAVAKAEQRGLEPEAVETLEEEAEPGRASELAVGRDLEAKLFLSEDDTSDLALQDGLVVAGCRLAAGDGGRGVLEDARPQQAADDLGAKRRRRHCCRLETTIFSGISGISGRELGVPGDPGTLPIGGRRQGKVNREALAMAT
jgi:hypothetical protein